MFRGIDLFSDTVTRPSAHMKEAMMRAELGDEQKGEDPTTRLLEEKIASLLGFTCALFLPSATMANEIALRAVTEPGDELMAYEDCHLFFAESGGPAVHANLLVKPIPSATGTFSGQDIRQRFRAMQSPLVPISKIVSVENTTNNGGGVPWSKDQLQDVVRTAKELKLQLHMDGARLFHAQVATGMKPSEIVQGFDLVTICLSKGLGCAAGALLVFDKSLYPKIRRLKQLMGGSLRQSGILAAAGLFALENNIQRLEQDHRNARTLASGLMGLSGIELDTPEPATNMVFFHWNSPKVSTAEFLSRCESKGVRFSQVGLNRVRAVTHLDVSAAQTETAVSVVKGICREL